MVKGGERISVGADERERQELEAESGFAFAVAPLSLL